ncbi:unnamed protein product [marine sediment metagenome]|uniref:Uncharacterized protein n=1 Tax=marine sediment metagenome TaxID=412755 RepID=X1MCV3_9ZZZZ
MSTSVQTSGTVDTIMGIVVLMLSLGVLYALAKAFVSVEIKDDDKKKKG